MHAANDGSAKAFDPFEPFRGVRDAYLDSMAKAMIEAVNTEEYAQATGMMLDSYLTASAPFREALEKSTVQAMQQLSLPSRQELAALAQRFTNLEMRLDDMDAKLDSIIQRSASEKNASASTEEPHRVERRPKRTKETSRKPVRRTNSGRDKR